MGTSKLDKYSKIIYNKLRNYSVKYHNAEVRTPFSLSKEQKMKLIDILKKRYQADIVLTEIIDESLIGGIVVKVNSEVNDFSLKSKLDNLSQNIKKEGGAYDK